LGGRKKAGSKRKSKMKKKVGPGQKSVIETGRLPQKRK